MDAKDAKKFTHLHVHFESSYLDGIIRYKDLSKIKEMGFEALTISDHGNVSGTYEFYKECMKVGMKPILGMEAYYCIGDKGVKDQDDLEGTRPNYHMILLAKNKIGYKNLVKMSSDAYTDGFYYSPRIDDKLIADHAEGIIATSACLGSRVSRLILKGRKEDAKALIQHHRSMFNDYFLELQCHYEPDQVQVNTILIEIAKELNIPLIMTADSHYLAFEDKELHDRFLCISVNKKVEDKNRFSFKDLDCHLASPETMEHKRKQFNLPEEAYTNTQYVADMCKPDYFSDITNQYPMFKDKPADMTSDEYLSYLVKTKWLEKTGGKLPPKDVRERVESELKIIKKMGFSDYMLLRWDVIENCAEKQGILAGPGRGSAAGSMVAYILGITKVDPIKYDLLFARFLNSGRGQLPKIFND